MVAATAPMARAWKPTRACIQRFPVPVLPVEISGGIPDDSLHTPTHIMSHRMQVVDLLMKPREIPKRSAPVVPATNNGMRGYLRMRYLKSMSPSRGTGRRSETESPLSLLGTVRSGLIGSVCVLDICERLSQCTNERQ